VTAALYRLGRVCTRRPWRVLALWLVLAGGLIGWASAAGSDLNDDLTLPGTGSQAATDLLDQRFPSQANGMTPLVLDAPSGTAVSSSRYRDAIDDTVSTLGRDADVRTATSPLSDAGAAQVSTDGRIAYIALSLRTGPTQLTLEGAQRIVDAADPASAAGLHVALGGYAGQKLSKSATESSEVVGLSMAVIVLLATFGTVVAMGLPIATALLGLICGLSIVTLLGHVVQVPTVAPTLATMIGLGVGIDYALFIVTRHRQTLHDGMEVGESIARATASSGGAVVFAGGTVIVALASLAVVRIPLVTTLGLTAALVVAIAALAAITLLPALLAVLGHRIDALALPRRHGAGRADGHPHGWMGWGAFVAHRPLPTLAVSLVVLAALAWPTLDLTLGQQDNGALPTDTQSRRSYDAMARGFGVGSNGPLLISVDLSRQPAKGAPADQPASDPRLQTLRDDLVKTPGVSAVSQPLVNSAGTAAVLNLTPTTSPSDDATADLVRTLRDDSIPPAERAADMSVDVGGTTAGYVDLANDIADRLPETIAVVIGLSFLLLMMAFRSIVIPLTAGLMNVISIGAAFGVVTAVFEKGWGASLVGLDGEVPIVSYVPLMMFAVLFGLSMDYEVFLMTHVREAWQRRRDNREAVVEGIGTTGRVITSAALIMVSVFFAFILNGDPTVKQFGVGMGVAVAVDATLVRCLLVPATMVLLGRANWWFPRWLERWLPNISIEGDEWFRRRDEAAAREVAPVP
jgi:putative drug exporter of the RND superfamily